jgi:hypothetical protein
VYIANSDGISVYRSLDEVPPALRKPLVKNSLNAATILIADRRTAQRLMRARRARPQPQARAHKRARFRLSLLAAYWGTTGLLMVTGLVWWWLSP